MANKRVFVAFAIEDETTKILFTGQAKNAKVPYEFVDMSVKEPFDEKWKTNCRTRIKGCDGFIALVSKNTKKQRVNCGKSIVLKKKKLKCWVFTLKKQLMRTSQTI